MSLDLSKSKRDNRVPIVFNLFGDEALCQKTAKELGGEVGALSHRLFPDGESYVRVLNRVKNRDVILLTCLDHPNEKFLPVLFAAQTLADQQARRIGLISPFLPYMRQDKSFEEGEGITQRYFATLLSERFDWMMTVDPHLHRVKNLSEVYDMKSMTVSAVSAISGWINRNVANPLIIGPDGESNQWASAVAKTLSVPFAVAYKDRCGDKCVEIDLPDITDHTSKTPVVVDDIISTAGTMIETVVLLKSKGMRAPICIGIHALFDKSVEQILRDTGADDIVTCNTIVHPSNRIDVSDLISFAAREYFNTPPDQ